MSLGAATGAAAATADRVDYRFGLTTRVPGIGSGMSLHIAHRDPSNPDGKPPAVTRNEIELPAGARFDDGAVPRCEASDADLRARGRDACPPQSVVGTGTIVVMTGFGPPADPYPTDVTLYNAEGSVIELVQQQGTNNTLAIDRAQVHGRTYVAAPPPTPGGPPDGQTVIRSVDFAFKPPASPRARSFITTPPTCTSAGEWSSRGRFTYADGVVVTKLSTTPCSATASRPALRIRSHRRPLGCARSTVRLRVRVTGGGALRRVRVRIDGHRRAARGVRSFHVRLRTRHLSPGRHRLTLTATDALGGRARRVVRFYRCSG